MNDAYGYDVGGSHRVQISQNDQENTLNESMSAWMRRLSPSLCQRKGEIGPRMRVLGDPTCETELNGDDGLRSCEILKSFVSDHHPMTPYV